MTRLILFGFAVEAGLEPEPGALPLDVLARQIPRVAVQVLNEGQDRGARFFPLMGQDGSRRRFFTVGELLPADVAQRLHRQPGGPRAAHGRIERELLRLVLYADAHPSVEQELAIPFRQGDPQSCIARVAFELSGWLGLRLQRHLPALLARVADADYLFAKDALLALEANMLDVDGERALAAALAVLRGAGEDPEAEQLLLDLAARLHGQVTPEVLGATLRAAAGLARGVGFQRRLAALGESCGDGDGALAAHRLLVAADPAELPSALKLAAALARDGELDAAADLLERAEQAGARSPLLYAQLATIEQMRGRRAARVVWIERLHAAGADATPQLARIAADGLIEQERGAEACALLDQALARHPSDAGLWFDRGRAELLHGDGAEAELALRRCLDCGPRGGLRQDAERLLAFAERPDVLTALQELDRLLLGGDAAAALAPARRLVRRHPDLAEVWLALGTAHHRLSHLRRAERAFRRALRLAPELGHAHDRLGILLVARGRHEEGYHHLLQAISLLPRDSGPRLHLAQACHHLGRRDEGIAALAEAEKLGAASALVHAVRRAFHPEQE
jgi:tetratricopeptide (TPR) repeat protein